MSQRLRRIFLMGFILLFLVTAPLVVLFATGYRFDPQSSIFVHSGSITIESWPRDVNVLLDGKLQERKTLNAINNSYTINGLRPGKYTLTCEKPGYTSWRKSIEVHSGISTEFWNVILFPQNDLQTVIFDTPTVDQFFVSPRQKNEVVVLSHTDAQNKILLLDTKEQIYDEIYSTSEYAFLNPDEKENVEWSTDNKKILVPLRQNDKKEYLIASIRNENLREVISLRSVLKEPSIEFRSVRWMFDRNDELVVLTQDHRLLYVYLDDPDKTIELGQSVSAFNFAGDRIYYSQLPNNIIWELPDIDPGSKRQITNITVLSHPNAFVELIVYDQYRIALTDDEHRLFVYNEEKEEGEKTLSEIGSDVQGVQFSNDGKKLLYWTNSEIWSLLLRDWEVQPIRTKHERLFITRFSQPLRNVQWLENYEHVLFSAGNTVKVAEIDHRDHINMVDVSNATFALEDRDVLYDKQTQRLLLRNRFADSFKLQSHLLIDKGGLFGL